MKLEIELRRELEATERQVEMTIALMQSEQSEQEPVAYLTKRKIGGTEGLLRADMVDKSAKNQETHDFIPLYTAPQRQREWVGLTEKDAERVYEDVSGQSLRPQDYRLVMQFAVAIEAKLKELNHEPRSNDDGA